MRLYAQNSQIVTLRGLVDAAGAPVEGATVKITLVDKAGDAQTGCNQKVLTDLAGVPGSYSGIVGESFDPDPGDYTLQVRGTKGDLLYYAEKPIKVSAQRL